ncbi:hypothetical protein HRG_005887 [Hirsutella rhossiliensis]|uniref:Uncharacterized protein n=1 Tax=Hirsutella rhossiliensis TaxID=111463 RepID=A0A9P8MXY3_9HYPO|nr:uncharacterized protein HRG_05887 [Hirsutella rhossiliensis]KAH0963377.1 hypothetical protein HRG_05887 [Hirsutella rhossiliensis]
MSNAASKASPAVRFGINTRPHDGRILLIGDARSSFDYSLNGTVVPDRIGWYFKPDSSQDYKLVDDAAFILPGDGASGLPSTSYFLTYVSQFSVQLNLSALRVKPDLSGDLSNFARRQDDTGDESRLRKKMMVRIFWTANSGRTGYSQSGLFTVAHSRDPQLVDEVRVWMDQPEGQNGTEGTISGDASVEGGTGGVTYDGGKAQESPNNQLASGSRGGGGGGLSTGAIAGIAVGVSLALILLVAGLAWFLLRRRHRKQHEAACAARRLTSKTSVEDKDMQAAHVADSPRSPYLDGGTSTQNQSSPVSPLAGASHSEGDDDQAGFTPHEAEVAALRSSHSSADDHDDPAQATQGVSNTVAHLVEEGMTAEEIRRLEDEERQLDAEIERAARR